MAVPAVLSELSVAPLSSASSHGVVVVPVVRVGLFIGLLISVGCGPPN